MNVGSAAVMDGDAVSTPAVSEVAISYGVFINTFIIVAFAIFMVVKAYNNMKKKEEEKPAPPPAPSNEVELLTEIRDQLITPLFF